jgi:D-glycero-alpha-D-manno-heptose-7-phosphate kinase
MSTDRADRLYDTARRNGVLGGKLVGAGGGGFLLLYSADTARTRRAMAEEGADEVRFGFDFQGCFGQEFS